MTAPDTGFSRLRREARATAILAAPVVLGQLSSMGMNVVDTVLAGRHGELTLAGVAVGSAVWSLVMLILIGVLMAVPPSVSQLHGAGRRAEVAPLFRQALWLALIMGVLLFVFAHTSGWLLAAIGIAEDVRPSASAFLGAIAWGAPALAVFFCCRYLSEGLSWTLPTMAFGLSGLLLLIPLGYLLMFGELGFPELGAAGLGYATAIVLWLEAIGFLIYLVSSPRFADLELLSRLEPPRWSAISDLLRIGVPMGVSIFMEGSLFVATALVIGTLGATAVAAHQIAINIASLAFMIPLGLAMATTVRVGFAAGRGEITGVRWAGGAGYALTLLTQTASASVMLLAAEPIAGLYTSDAEVIRLAASLMLLAAAFQFSDGIQVASAGALRGLKDTRVPMLMTVFAYWMIGMPLGSWLGLYAGFGPAGMWWGLIVGLTTAAVLLGARFVHLTRARAD